MVLGCRLFGRRTSLKTFHTKPGPQPEVLPCSPSVGERGTERDWWGKRQSKVGESERDTHTGGFREEGEGNGERGTHAVTQKRRAKTRWGQRHRERETAMHRQRGGRRSTGQRGQRLIVTRIPGPFLSLGHQFGIGPLGWWKSAFYSAPRPQPLPSVYPAPNPVIGTVGTNVHCAHTRCALGHQCGPPSPPPPACPSWRQVQTRNC